MLFDQPYYLEINQVRWDFAQKILQEINTTNNMNLSTCLDVGCGPGWFAEKLVDLGLQVYGIDGRQDLITTAKQRVPKADFTCIDVQSTTEMSTLSPVDLVFCFGLLYHTENPWRVIHNLYPLTKKILFIESIVIPEDKPICWLVEEGKNETQGLTHHALIPSPTAIIKMLQIAQFPHIYEYTGKINHKDFLETPTKHKRRIVLIASQMQLKLKDLVPFPEIPTPKYNFNKQA